jgi:hypothetical protein
METELERQRLNASQELLLETTRLYREFQEREAEVRALKDGLQRENLALRDEVDRASMFEEMRRRSKAAAGALGTTGFTVGFTVRPLDGLSIRTHHSISLRSQTDAGDLSKLEAVDSCQITMLGKMEIQANTIKTILKL